MATLTAAQVAGYARNAGFKQPALAVMVAIAFAESGFKTDARNPNSTATGLWQILASHKQFAGWDLTNPEVNAKAAKKLYDDAKGSFTPWASSQKAWQNPEAIKKGMIASSSNESFIDKLIPDPIQDAAGAAKNAAGAAVDAAQSVGHAVGWLSNPHNLQRVAYVWVGGLLIIVGMSIMAFPAAKPVVAAASKVVPLGKVASVTKLAS